MEITSTEAQNNFGKYLKLAVYEDIIVTKNGKKTAVIKSYDRVNQDSQIVEKRETYNWGESRISYEEFLQLANRSEKRYEYIDGKVYLLASPTYDHQRIVVEILNIMYQWFKGKKCRPLTAPLDVTLYKDNIEENKNVVQPDVLVICDTEKINDNGIYTGVPALVVEVLSESTKSKDLLIKLDLYINSGVKEYWIVNPFNEEVYLYLFAEGEISEYQVFKRDKFVKSFIFTGLEVELRQVFNVTD